MKINGNQLADLTSAINYLDTDERRAAYRNGDFPRADRCRDLNKRYRWDLLWASAPAQRIVQAIEGLTDAHIDTALRSAVPSL